MKGGRESSIRSSPRFDGNQQPSSQISSQNNEKYSEDAPVKRVGQARLKSGKLASGVGAKKGPLGAAKGKGKVQGKKASVKAQEEDSNLPDDHIDSFAHNRLPLHKSQRSSEKKLQSPFMSQDDQSPSPLKPTSSKGNSTIGKHLTGRGSKPSAVSGFASQSTARGGGSGAPNNNKINEEEEDTDFNDSALAATDDVTEA